MSTKANIPPSAAAPERRVDGPVHVIDEAVVLAAVDGVGPAIDHMDDAGIERSTALRVLSAPENHREPETETVEKVLQHKRVTALPKIR